MTTRIAPLLLTAFIIISCSSSPEEDFEKAASENSVTAYEQFIEKHSESEFANKAQLQIYETEYADLKNEDDDLILEKYALENPQSPYTKELLDLSKTLAYQKISKSTNRDELISFINRFPESEQADSVVVSLLESAYDEAVSKKDVATFKTALSGIPIIDENSIDQMAASLSLYIQAMVEARKARQIENTLESANSFEKSGQIFNRAAATLNAIAVTYPPNHSPQKYHELSGYAYCLSTNRVVKEMLRLQFSAMRSGRTESSADIMKTQDEIIEDYGGRRDKLYENTISALRKANLVSLANQVEQSNLQLCVDEDKFD